MNISVDINLFATLVECLEKQAVIENQTPEVQVQWRQIFADTQRAGRTALNQALMSSGNGDPRRTETGMGPLLSPGDTPYL
jgi:hypothetical protein